MSHHGASALASFVSQRVQVLNGAGHCGPAPACSSRRAEAGASTSANSRNSAVDMTTTTAGSTSRQ